MALIIAGHARSGTSILRRVCAGHPDCTVTREFGNFYKTKLSYSAYRRFIFQRWYQKRNAPFLSGYPLGAAVKGANMVHNLLFVMKYLQKVRAHTKTLVDATVIEAAMKELFPQTCLVGDKYPDYSFKLKDLTEDPSVKCLFIYRDPRDVASSSVKKARTVWKKSWPEELQEARNVAIRWVQLVESMEKYRDRLHMVRYEDLVTEPQAVMDNIGTWLGIDPQKFPYHEIRTTSVGNYRDGLTPQEISDVLEVAEPTMLRVGYKL